MTPTKRKRLLDEIYTALPTVTCKGLCAESCAAVPAYPVEIARLELVAKRRLPVLGTGIGFPGTAEVLAIAPTNLVCPLLLFKKCSVYQDRPFICRIFGVAKGLPCPHGCQPSRILTDREVMDIQRTLEKL